MVGAIWKKVQQQQQTNNSKWTQSEICAHNKIHTDTTHTHTHTHTHLHTNISVAHKDTHGNGKGKLRIIIMLDSEMDWKLPPTYVFMDN
jgi:hypothetical protein